MGGALRGCRTVGVKKTGKVRKMDGRELERDSDSTDEHVHVLATKPKNLSGVRYRHRTP
jgi:hypothetical protein